nr:transcription and mRNA export factor ENY2 isoform X2 [Crassostrea gigas]|eukprot:XP_019923709.1 PREDICTED: transcription and mRNA export factor ENY2 isoform X2 [Crassostrea gigas]
MADDIKRKDAQMRATINQKLVETGERDRLKDLLRTRLIECGWRDQLKQHCKGVIIGLISQCKFSLLQTSLSNYPYLILLGCGEGEGRVLKKTYQSLLGVV